MLALQAKLEEKVWNRQKMKVMPSLDKSALAIGNRNKCTGVKK
jgi:hypothetical protein